MMKWLAWVVCGLVLAAAGCASRQPVRVGLAVELTGPRSEVGVAARNGAELAVEAVNAAGGVAGRPLKLLIRDDKGLPEGARLADGELIAEQVVAIIGHITSEQTAAALEQINRSEVVLLSPTSSSSMFTGMADYLFRVMPGNDRMAASLAHHIYTTRGLRQALVIYDLANRSFSETWWQHFQQEFQALGGDCAGMGFSSGETDLKQLVASLSDSQPEAVVFIASAVDTAVMMQYAKQAGLEAQFFASSWAQTTELLEKGGQVVNGLEMSTTYDPNAASAAFTRFKQDYQSRFSSAPTLGASHAYEAVLVLAAALEATGGKAEGLPEALQTIENFPGLQGEITMDAWGDVRREVYIMRVENGQFVLISVVSLTE